MIEKSNLIKEIDSLPPYYYREVIDFVGYIKERKNKIKLSLEKAADLAAEDYRNDKELTIFTCLDGEDFYEPR